MELLAKVLLSLSVPSVATLILAPDEMIPKVEVVARVSFAPAARLQFLMTLLVAPAPVPALDNHTTAVNDPVDVLIIVKLRSVLALKEPSMVTRSAPFSLIRAAVAEPEMVRVAPVGTNVIVKLLAGSSIV